MHTKEKHGGVMMKKSIHLIILLCVCNIFIIILNAASSHTIYGVLDRYTSNGSAVILIEDKEEEWIVQEDDLPESSKEGVWFKINKNNDVYIIDSIDWKRTNEAEKKSQYLMKRLRNK